MPILFPHPASTSAVPSPRGRVPTLRSFRGRAVILLAVALLAGCATAYQPSGFTGGFEETRLSDDMYEVRFFGNGYTSSGRTSQFVLRRCAELALENGYRYFELVGETDNDYSQDMWISRPRTFARIRLVREKTDSTADAVYIIDDTNAAADGQLSPAARRTLQKIRVDGQP